MSGRDDRAGRPADGVVRISLERRRVCRWLLLPAAQWLVPAAAWASAARIASARMWPAQEYTRVIFEAPVARPARGRHPEGSEPGRAGPRRAPCSRPSSRSLPLRVQPSDPYIAAIRFGTKAPDILRVVFDLKTETRPQLFALKPVAEFGHRVVLDLYPLTPVDPLMALLEEKRDAPPAERDVRRRPAGPDAGAPGPPAQSAKPAPDHRSRSIPATAARIPARSAAAARTRRTSPSRSAKKLKRIIDAEPGMRAMLTRDDDYYVPLAARVQKARRVQADLFVSSTPTPSARRRRAARRSSRCPRTARPAPPRGGSRSARTPPT